MSVSNGYSSLKKFTSRAWSYIVDSPQQHPSLVAYSRYALPLQYQYKRPEFLDLDDEALAASADHEIRPILHAKRQLLMNAGYAEVINAGKTLRTNEDQASFHAFVVTVPLQMREEYWTTELCQIPCAYFGVFDGHAGTGAALYAYHNLHHRIKEKLTAVSHMLVLSQDDFARTYMTTGLITSIDAEQLIKGALEQAFVAMDDDIKRSRYDVRIEGGCTALCVVFIMGKMYVVNAGDCRAVLYKSDSSIVMSRDHTPESERKRIQTLASLKPDLMMGEYTRFQFQHRCRKKDIGTYQLYRDYFMDGWSLKVIDKNDMKPQLISGEGKRARLLDTIGTTRGFGDHDLQVPYCADIKIKPFLSPAPEIKVVDLHDTEFTNNDVLVMATDGLWEKLSNENIGEIVVNKLKEQPADNSHRYVVAAHAIIEQSRGVLTERGWRMLNDDTGSYDDISAFVIPLCNWKVTLNSVLLQHLKRIKSNTVPTNHTSSFYDDDFLDIPHEVDVSSHQGVTNIDIPALNAIEKKKGIPADALEQDNSNCGNNAATSTTTVHISYDIPDK